MCSTEVKCEDCGATIVRREGRGRPLKRCRSCTQSRRLAPAKTRQVCEQCKCAFVPRKYGRKEQRFCSKECADSWYYNSRSKQAFVCQECKREFHPKAVNRTKFCSRDCAFIGMGKKRAEEKRARETAEKIRRLFENMRQCEVCKFAFSSPLKSKTCSEECQKKRKAGPLDKPCKTCGKPLGAFDGKKRFQCAECRAEVHRLNRKRAKWERKRRKYEQTAGDKATASDSREMLNLLRHKLQRAGNKCHLCGLLASKRIDPNSDRAAEFDHKVPLARGGSDKIDNLQVICRKCNGLKADTISVDSFMHREWKVHECTM